MLENYSGDLGAKCDECGGFMEFNFSDFNPAYRCVKCHHILEV